MLFFEIMRLVEEWEDNKPKILLFENSPNILEGAEGMWFHEIKKHIARAGYWFNLHSCIKMDTYKYTDSPQRRNRVFMIAFNKRYFNQNKIAFSEIDNTDKDMSLFVNFEGEFDNKYYLDHENRYYEMIMEGSDEKKRLYHLRKYLVRKQEMNVCPTLTANMGTGGHNVPFIKNGKKIRKLTERECLNLQGFPKTFKWPKNLSLGRRYKMIGNAVSPKISSVIADELSRQLSNL